MPKRRLVPLLAAVAAVGLASTGCADQSAAIRVGDDTVSEKDLLDELKVYGENEAVAQGLGLSQGDDIGGDLGDDSFQREFVVLVVQQRIVSLLQQQVAEDEGIEVTVDDIQATRDQLESEMTNAGLDADGLPDVFLDQLAEDFTVDGAVNGALGQDGAQSALLEMAKSTDIELSPRFGEWDATMLQIVLPEGPLASPDAPATDDLDAADPGATGG